MHSRLCLRLAGSQNALKGALGAPRCSFANSAPLRASDAARDLEEVLRSGRPPRSDGQSSPSRGSAEPADASNPLLQGYQSSSGRQTTSTASPDTTTAESAPEVRSASNVPIRRAGRPSEGNSTQKLLDHIDLTQGRVRRTNSGSPNNTRTNTEPRVVTRRREEQLNIKDSKLLFHQPRRWQVGEVYSPHDLSPVEAQKNSRSRQALKLRVEGPPKGRGYKDALDEMGIDPRLHYSNFAMMGEFVSDMGRIHKRTTTQLRPKNQRRMAKAVRRAIGLGLVPSVHKHPELLAERVSQKGYPPRGGNARGLPFF